MSDPFLSGRKNGGTGGTGGTGGGSDKNDTRQEKHKKYLRLPYFSVIFRLSKGRKMSLAQSETYADCSFCEKVFVVDKYVSYHFCNYCKGSLTKRG